VTFDLSRRDTICAPATAAGPAALSIVRVSGTRADEVRERVFRARRGTVRAFVATLGDVVDSEGALLDEALCTRFPEGRSYTGEASFELSLHGGPGRTRAVMAALMRAGCRLAEPGEFTLRAVLTGRLDLAAAEGVAAVIEARTDAAARVALRQVAGQLGDSAGALADALVEVLAELESRMDYPDEDLGDASRAELTERLCTAERELGRMLDGAALGRRLSEGARVVLYGRPNAGKSTLLNALLGEERALVHDSPGTTRDVLEAEANVGGVPCLLIDVAGVREGDDVGEVEALGIARSRRELDRADVIVRLTAPDEPAPLTLPAVGAPVVDVATKSDLGAPPTEGAIAVAATTGTGLGELIAVVAQQLTADTAVGEVLLTRERQVRETAAARQAVRRATDALEAAAPDEVVCAELRLATAALARLLGRDLNEAILDEVFSRFCVGK
jgi:tRNA modification GTPase